MVRGGLTGPALDHGFSFGFSLSTLPAQSFANCSIAIDRPRQFEPLLAVARMIRVTRVHRDQGDERSPLAS
jgi:hypothetical protein